MGTFSVPLVAECTKPVEDPVFQNDVPSTEVRYCIYFSADFFIKYTFIYLFDLWFFCSLPNQALESCPKKNINNLKEMLKEENLHLHTEVMFYYNSVFQQIF